VADFENILAGDAVDRQKLEKILRELSPVYALGESIEEI
jgi:hypothetical protein